MASNTLRQFIYAAYISNPVLLDLGFNQDNISPNFSPDGPAGDLFLVIRWDGTTRGIGAVNRVRLSCWAYNRQPDYAPIADALREIRRILPPLAAMRMSATEAIINVVHEGDSGDLYDQGYRAYTRSTNHTITASGS